MTYIAVGFVCVMLGILISRFDDIKRELTSNAEKRRYKKLMNGTPKRTVFLTCWDDYFKYRKYPIYVNGEVLGISLFQFWHCNDEFKTIVNTNKKGTRYLIQQVVGQKKKGGGWHHYAVGAIAQQAYNQSGAVINASAVLEVY